MKRNGSRKQDLYKFIHIALANAGFSVDAANDILGKNFYKKNTAAEMELKLKGIKKVISGSYTEEEFKAAFG